jgi:hypothetical protein
VTAEEHFSGWNDNRLPNTLRAEPRVLKGRKMVNKNKNRRNQPPTGAGKRQSTHLGEPRKLAKRSDVLQAQRHHPELNLGDSDEEAASREGDQPNPRRPKAGR